MRLGVVLFLPLSFFLSLRLFFLCFISLPGSALTGKSSTVAVSALLSSSSLSLHYFLETLRVLLLLFEFVCVCVFAGFLSHCLSSFLFLFCEYLSSLYHRIFFPFVFRELFFLFSCLVLLLCSSLNALLC